MIAVQLASATSANVIQLTRCRPIFAAWRFDTETTAACYPLRIVYISAYTNGSIAVITDLILAAIPLTFLDNIRRSPRERVLIALLMGLGVFAAAAEAVKLSLIRSYGQTGDMLWDCVGLVTWSILEAQIGIVAACVPCLKGMVQVGLRRVGLLGATGGRGRTIYLNGVEEGFGIVGVGGVDGGRVIRGGESETDRGSEREGEIEVGKDVDKDASSASDRSMGSSVFG